MSRAAQQLRERLEVQFPGIRIGRRACRPTAGGSVSQHSAYCSTCYDSNALDIMGAPLAWGLTYAQTQRYLDGVYAFIMANQREWSTRICLWRVPDHHGHIHWDAWPTCLEPEWCGRNVVPRWSYSNGETFTAIDPMPENGPYSGPPPFDPDEEDEDMPTLEVFIDKIRKVDIEKMGADGLIKPEEVAYFTGGQLWINDDEKAPMHNADWSNLYDAYRVRAPIWAV